MVKLSSGVRKACPRQADSASQARRQRFLDGRSDAFREILPARLHELRASRKSAIQREAAPGVDKGNVFS